MKEQIHSILNIKLSESKQVFDLVIVQFFIGLANAFVNIIAFTLFIFSFPINILPQVYLAIAVTLIVFNLVYEKLEHRFSAVQLLKFIIVSSAIILLLFWIGLSLWNKHNIIPVLLIWSTLIYMVTGYAFWGLVSLLFNIRESKRVFSVIGAGDIPAKLIGYATAPLLIAVLGLTNLIGLSILSLIMGYLAFNRVIKKKNWEAIRKKSHIEHHETEKQQKKDLLGYFFKNELIFTISLLSLLSYNVFNFIDFTFLSQVKLKYHDIASLATFIAIFFALGRFIALILKLIFTSRVIEQLGLIYCLLITPFALLLFCLVFFAFENQSSYTIYIFGLMAMITEVLRATMQEPIFFILFQPLKEHLRLKGHIISKGYMLVPSLIIVGLTLIILLKMGITITILLTIKILLINLVVWVFIIYFIRKSYLKTLHSSIKKGVFSSDELKIYDQETIDLLLNKIKNGRNTEVIYALKLLESANYPHFDQILEKQLNASDIEVKKYVLDRLETREKVNIETLKTLLTTESNTEIKQKLVSILCKHDPVFLNAASDEIASYEYSIRKVIIVNLLNHRESTHLFKAGKEINDLIYSSTAVERELAVTIISELKNIQFTDAIEVLINDKETLVKRSAIIAACKLKAQRLLPIIISLLAHPLDRYLVLQGLQQYGDELFLDIQTQSDELVVNHSSEFIKIAGKTKGQHSTNFLMTQLTSRPHSSEKIIHALWTKEYTADKDPEINRLFTLLDIHLKMGLEKVTDYYNVPKFKEQEMVKSSINSEIKNDLITSLKICSILFHKKEINRILELLEIGVTIKLYNAIEMLELVLPKRISKELNHLFDFVIDSTQTKKYQSKHEMKTFFDKIVFNNSGAFNPWTKAVCMYCSWKNNEIDFLKNLKANPCLNENPILTETRNYVLKAIK